LGLCAQGYDIISVQFQKTSLLREPVWNFCLTAVIPTTSFSFDVTVPPFSR